MILSDLSNEESAGSVIVVEDHPLFNEALRRVVERALPEAEIVCYHEGSALLAFPSSILDARLLILDLVLPDFDWRETLSVIRDRSPDLPILVISNLQDQKTIQDVMSRGANGFLPKSASSDVIKRVIRHVATGGTYIPDSILVGEPASSAWTREKPIPERIKTHAPQETEIASLTSRQLDVLRQIAAGKSNKDIANSLNISISTVKIHINTIFLKLGFKNRTEAALFAYRWFNEEEGEAN